MKTLAKRLRKEKENVRYYKERYEKMEMLAAEIIGIEKNTRKEMERLAAVNAETRRYVIALAKRLAKDKEVNLSMEEIKGAKEEDLKIRIKAGEGGKVKGVGIKC